ncbi:TetR/AcrR family transcriptional regulator [Rhizobiaceae bacterium n13]|uniref:TetR/AcrR family transcriptional regulator n=1 Tax=Ferirhizobium litorale TaxID=2927786 RepID=A0AAE3QFG3_9HYPH|nr:TetR/AcrR family transcriptional regulator [Fererhizobium litorale]MDI7864713.1 TetR/AcrR family transcriptional regulator [Fererhizobium litorale]MDI7922204.1 TetR/AcrR family transcriptional regulator [Fererhizobium litorale]
MKTAQARAGGRPTREEAENLSRQILDDARATFAKKGVANATMEEIAAHHAISKHTLYRRYPNKQVLLEAVVERDLLRFRRALAQAAKQREDPLPALHAIAFRYFLFGTDREYSAFYLSVTAEAVVSASLRERLAIWSSIALEPMVDAIIAAQASGAIIAGDAAEICGVLVDLLEGANNRIRLGLRDSPDDAECRRVFESRWTIFQTAMTPKST